MQRIGEKKEGEEERLLRSSSAADRCSAQSYTHRELKKEISEISRVWVRDLYRTELLSSWRCLAFRLELSTDP